MSEFNNTTTMYAVLYGKRRTTSPAYMQAWRIGMVTASWHDAVKEWNRLYEVDGMDMVCLVEWSQWSGMRVCLIIAPGMADAGQERRNQFISMIDPSLFWDMVEQMQYLARLCINELTDPRDEQEAGQAPV